MRIDVQADRFAIDLMSQRGVAMAGKTFLRSGFRGLLASWLPGGVGGYGNEKQGESNSGRKNTR